MAREKVKFDLSTYKQEKAEKVAEIEAKKKGFNVFKTPADVEVLKLPKYDDSKPALVYSLDFLSYEQTREPKNIPMERYGREYTVHNNLGPDGNKFELCPKTFGGKCPICDKINDFYKREATLSKNEKQEFEKLKNGKKKHSLFNVIHDGEVKLFDVPYGKFGKEFNKLLDTEALDVAEVKGFACDEGGYTVRCTFGTEVFKDGTKKNPYYKLAGIKLSKRGPIPDEVFPMIIDLDELFPNTKYEDLLKYVSDDFVGDVEEDGDEVEEEKTPISNRRIGVTKKEPTWDTAEAPAEEDDKIPFDDYKKAKEEPEEAEEEEPRTPKARRRFTV